jgi:hypothetical protein
MHLRSLSVIFAGVLAAPAGAQALIAPAVANGVEGNYDNSLPLGFGGAQQAYQQVHADLAGRAGTFARLSLRRDGVYATNPALLAKTLTASMWFGEGRPIASMTTSFANNFVAAPSQVLAARTISVPDWTQRPASAPAAFDVLIPLDAPFTWNGAGSFAWEMRVHAMTATHPMFADALRTNARASSSGFNYGTACTLTGGSMQLFGGATANLGVGHGINLTLMTPRNSAPALLWFGVTQTNLSVPGLCRPVVADLAVLLPGATDASGMYGLSLPITPYRPALAGLTVVAQGAVADVGRADPIPVALSAGLRMALPAVTPPPVARRYHASDDTAATGFLDPNGIWLGSVIRLD